MWDAAEDVARYEAWYASPKGAFALAREQRLIAALISAWPRRGQSLLEIGCGAGHFLELFYGAGFDVTGVDSSLPMLDAARMRMGHRATLRMGQAQHLPFDDGEFDFAAMITSLECMDDPETVLNEAFRVATKSVLIIFLNAWSLYRLEQKLRGAWSLLPPRRGKKPAPRGALERAQWYSLVGMLKAIYNVSGKRPKCFRSVLFSPSALWRGDKAACIPLTSVLPFGAVVGVRVDLSSVCVTPLLVRPGKVVPAVQ